MEMRIKVGEFMRLKTDTYMRLFNKPTALTQGSVWSGYPNEDWGWIKYHDWDIVQIEAVNENTHGGEIYIVMD